MAILGKEAGGRIHTVQQIETQVVHQTHSDEMMGVVLAMQKLEHGLLVGGTTTLQHLEAGMELVVPTCAVNFVQNETPRSKAKQLLWSGWL